MGMLSVLSTLSGTIAIKQYFSSAPGKKTALDCYLGILIAWFSADDQFHLNT